MSSAHFERHDLERLEFERDRAVARSLETGAFHGTSREIDETRAPTGREGESSCLRRWRRAVCAYFVRVRAGERSSGGKNYSEIVAAQQGCCIVIVAASEKNTRRRSVRLDSLQQIAFKIAAAESRDRKFEAMRPQLLGVGRPQLRSRTATPGYAGGPRQPP